MKNDLFGQRDDHSKSIEKKKNDCNKIFKAGWKSAEKEIKKHRG